MSEERKKHPFGSSIILCSDSDFEIFWDCFRRGEPIPIEVKKRIFLIKNVGKIENES